MHCGNRFAGDGKRGRVRRMAMDDRLDVAPRLHDREVQQDLARPLPLSRDLVPLQIDGADVVRRHVTLADHRRRAKDFVLTDADRQVAVVGRGKPLLINPPADLADQLFELPVMDLRWSNRWSSRALWLSSVSPSLISAFHLLVLIALSCRGGCRSVSGDFRREPATHFWNAL